MRKPRFTSMKRSSLFSPFMTSTYIVKFSGLSVEQALLATLAAQNPAAAPSVRMNAKSLLLLNEGATVAEVAQTLSVSRRLITSLISRFKSGGFCHAVLGGHPSQARRIWLLLNPASPPQVIFQRTGRSRKRAIDTATPSVTYGTQVIAAPLSPPRQACSRETNVKQADPHHQGGPLQATPHA
jgi:hypothetical protein